MGLFDDRSKLRGRNFGWGLAAYSEQALVTDDDVFGAGAEPEDASRIAIFVDEEGEVNVDTKLTLYAERDPIDAPIEATYSKDNKFVSGLRKAIGPFPLYGIIAYPIVVPGSVQVRRGGELGIALGLGAFGGKEARYPNDTPEGFVPCAGQILRYRGGGVVAVPNLGPRVVTGGAGDGSGTSVAYSAPPGTAYLIKVPEGWTEMVPELDGKKLAEFGTPAPSALSGII